MTRRTYDQYCPAAKALDVVGDRWTLLVARELLVGPKRYSDLLDGLPGIGPNVLAGRLRELQEASVVRKTTLDPPARVTVYELTELGHGLRPVLLALFRWGIRVMGEPRPNDSFRLSWMLAAIQVTARRDLTVGLTERYEFRVDDDVFTVDVDDGEISLFEGPAVDPAFVAETDLVTFLAIGARRIDVDEAVAGGALRFRGDREAGERSIEIIGTASPLAHTPA